MSRLCEKLRVLLSNNEWTQKRVADQLFVSPDAVSSWIRDINHPDLNTLKGMGTIRHLDITAKR